jgi:signal transduction histidine kinase
VTSGTPAVPNRFALTDFRIDLALTIAVAVTVIVGVWSEVTYWTSPVANPAGAYAIGLGASAAILVRRRHPIILTIALIGLVALYHFLGYPGGAPALALFVSLYAIAAYGKTLWWSLLAIGFVGIWQIIPALPPTALPWDSFATTGPAMGMVWLIVIGAAAGQLRRAHAENLRIVTANAEAQTRERLAAERLEMARELHDVLAHTISVISVQSGVALDALDDRPGEARASIKKVRALARQAVLELRKTLNLLRSEGQTATNLPPQPALAQLAGLMQEATATGLHIESEITIDEQLLTPFVQLTAYRIIQEALTNVIRHAHASAVRITLHTDGTTLTLQVADNGTGSEATASPGLGLLGMRERIQALGGALTLGPNHGNGFVVKAVLPIESP